MRSYKKKKKIAVMTGITVDEVRTMMRAAYPVGSPEYKQLSNKVMIHTVWRVGNAATGCIGSGYTREEAVIYALEHNLQFAKVL